MKLRGKPIRLTKVERQTYGRDTLSRKPCAKFDSAQIPEEKQSVCVRCGWMRKRHGQCQCARGVTTENACIDRLRNTGRH